MNQMLLTRQSVCYGSRNMRRGGVTRRRGMSLLEVMLAIGILLGSVMVLSRMAFLARRHAHGAEDRTGAQIHCQNIMEELLAGARPLRSVSPELLEGGLWAYMVDVESIETGELKRVAVTVERLDGPEDTVPGENEMGGFRLVRWVREAAQERDRGLGILGDQADQGFTEQVEGRLRPDGDVERVPSGLGRGGGRRVRPPVQKLQPEPEIQDSAPPEF